MTYLHRLGEQHLTPPDPAPDCECRDCACDDMQECHDSDDSCGCCRCGSRQCHDCWEG